MSTESRNPRSEHLSEMSTEEIVRLMNEEDAAVITAVKRCVPEVAAIADMYAETLKNGGRVFYLGAGTSGGLALLDAAEVPPTFGLSPDHVIALTAEEGINYSTDDEDSLHRAKEQLQGDIDYILSLYDPNAAGYDPDATDRPFDDQEW